jgi:UDP-3-O-[3-hydroxymyristoyl] N-acetylglucosamine deacetylase
MRMDGLPRELQDESAGRFQRTLKVAIHCVGVGLHSGRAVKLTLQPAAPNTGIVFRRTDLDIDIPARFDAVVDTRLCTVLAAPNAPHARVGTVEHVSAALIACGIDNAIVAVDGCEIPVLDGSAAPFVFLIDCAGIAEQSEPRRTIEVLRTVRVTDGESFVEIRPATVGGMELAVSINFDAAAIGQQALSLRMGETNFRHNLAHARTFAMATDIAGLQAAGLAQGGSLENAVVVDGARVLNPGGLRMTDEFVRHKMLDVVGDLALAGAQLRARVVAHRPGHSLNNRALRALFADQDAWTWADTPMSTGWAKAPLQAAA